jgi:hypothetical protein
VPGRKAGGRRLEDAGQHNCGLLIAEGEFDTELRRDAAGGSRWTVVSSQPDSAGANDPFVAPFSCIGASRRGNVDGIPLNGPEREEAVQGAGTVAFVLALRAAASDVSDATPVASRRGVSFAAETIAHFVALDRPLVGSHVPGTRRDRAQAEEAGVRKAKP